MPPVTCCRESAPGCEHSLPASVGTAAGVPDALDLIPASVGRTGEELLAAELIEATGHGLTPADASLLYSTAILGMSVAEVADHTGESVVRLRRRRRNAIAGLVA